jgi:hypothetical protein
VPDECARILPGFPEMWQPVFEKYRPFFEAAWKASPLVNQMTSQGFSDQLSHVVACMVFAAANTLGAIITLVMNGYGHDAMKLARSIYETELNIIWLKNHPEEVEDFVDYNVIQQKQLYDSLGDEQRSAFPKEQYEEMMAAYCAILPRFASGRDKTRPRNEWCRVSIYDRAREAEQYWQQQMEKQGQEARAMSLYSAFYRPASSLHHGDIGGLIAQVDSDLNAETAPSWSWLDDALVNSIGSFVRCLAYFDEIAVLGFKERIKSGPMGDYVAAIKTLAASRSESA